MNTGPYGRKSKVGKVSLKEEKVRKFYFRWRHLDGDHFVRFI